MSRPVNADKLLAIIILGALGIVAMWLGIDGGKDVALTCVGAIGGMTVSHALSQPTSSPPPA